MTDVDIWAWFSRVTQDIYSAGDRVLAQRFRKLPSHVVAHRHEEVDASYPELLAAAKALRNPWLEIYVRHWRMQSLFLRRQTSIHLAEAVATLELAHRPETIDCPQSVCVVQDLCIAYGLSDGPGYVAERLAVVAETFERIDPTWNCYRCIAIEEATALGDAGRMDEMVVTVRRRHQDYHAAHGKDAHSVAELAEVVMVSGDAESALELARSVPSLGSGAAALHNARVTTALALLSLGRTREAGEALPSLESAEEFDSVTRWAEVHVGLVRSGDVPSSVAVASALGRHVRRLIDGGAAWPAFELAERVAQLAVTRGARESALIAVRLCDEARAGLRDPSRVDDRVARLLAEATSIAAIELPCDPNELAAHIEALHEIEPEVVLDQVEVALLALPTDTPLRILRARLLSVMGRSAEADAGLWSLLEADPSSEQLAAALMQVQWDDNGALLRLAALVRGEQPRVAAWAEANVAFRMKDYETVIARCRAIVANDPSVVNTRRMWASACRSLGRHAEEQQVWQQLIDLGGEVDPGDRWELLTAASIEGDWAVVRRESAVLGIELDGDEGPVDERWSYVRIRFAEAGDDHDDPDLLAIRTGPVTALVVGANHVEAPQQRYEDRIVFHSTPLNQRPDDPEGDWEPLFRHLATVAPGGYRTFEVEGEWPGEEAWDAARQAIVPADVRRWSSPEFRLLDAKTDTEVEAFYAMYLVPPEWSTEEAAQRLTELTTDWPSPLFWPTLAEAAGLDPEPHRERARRYGYD